ncbi:hypothetical protein GCM10009096_15070 [Parasphingorhabdus litoris]|uniref:Uncharacterized protein n=1 Tax=Parasphingorhabdus litoris TaxID=394733 RepID=A0ABN1AEF0_9SPHN
MLALEQVWAQERGLASEQAQERDRQNQAEVEILANSDPELVTTLQAPRCQQRLKIYVSGESA